MLHVPGRLSLLMLAVGAPVALAACGSSPGRGGGVEVPEVRKLDAALAVIKVTRAGLTPSLIEAGSATITLHRSPDGCVVKDQDLVPGTEAKRSDKITLLIDCRSGDWANHRGAAWAAFSAGFSDGFPDGCAALFRDSPDGSLYDGHRSYTVQDCQALEPHNLVGRLDVPSALPQDPENVGRDSGIKAGCRALFNSAPAGLSSVTGGTTAKKCVAAAQHGADAGRPPPHRPSCGKQDQAAGRPFAVIDIQGHVDCRGALALWKDYVRRARQEGQGSGAAVTIDRWTCLYTPPPQFPLLGQCYLQEGKTEFWVRDVGPGTS